MPRNSRAISRRRGGSNWCCLKPVFATFQLRQQGAVAADRRKRMRRLAALRTRRPSKPAQAAAVAHEGSFGGPRGRLAPDRPQAWHHANDRVGLELLLFLPSLQSRSHGISALRQPTCSARFRARSSSLDSWGPRVGHAIDTFGGRWSLLAISNLRFAAGLLILPLSSGTMILIAAWALLGVGMGMGLYEAAFATLARIYGSGAELHHRHHPDRRLGRTVGWPLLDLARCGARLAVACQVWAVIHIALALPLNLSLPNAAPLASRLIMRRSITSGRSELSCDGRLAYMFAAASFVSSRHLGAPADHAGSVRRDAGSRPARRRAGRTCTSRRASAGSRLARTLPSAAVGKARDTAHNPIGVAIIVIGGPFLASTFTVLYGAGNGIITIARGTLPLALFGPGIRQARRSDPSARVTGARRHSRSGSWSSTSAPVRSGSARSPRSRPSSRCCYCGRTNDDGGHLLGQRSAVCFVES